MDVWNDPLPANHNHDRIVHHAPRRHPTNSHQPCAHDGWTGTDGRGRRRRGCWHRTATRRCWRRRNATLSTDDVRRVACCVVRRVGVSRSCHSGHVGADSRSQARDRHFHLHRRDCVRKQNTWIGAGHDLSAPSTTPTGAASADEVESCRQRVRDHQRLGRRSPSDVGDGERVAPRLSDSERPGMLLGKLEVGWWQGRPTRRHCWASSRGRRA